MSSTARPAPPLCFLSTASSISTKRRTNVKFISTTYSHSFCLLCCASDSETPSSPPPPPPPSMLKKKRNRYRKLYPGESTGITEEMRFVAMRLRNPNAAAAAAAAATAAKPQMEEEETEKEKSDGAELDTWQPSMEGFLSYLVDSKLVFNTVERIVDESGDVSYAYFRNTGLERSEGLLKDLEGFEQQGVVIPEPRTPGLSYAKYLEELAETSAPLFLSHFYNIYFSHIAGGQVIAKQVSKKLLEGKELEFYRWEGDAAEMLKGVRENLNMLAEHWSRDEKNRCLKETTKSFKLLGQIVRLIIL